MRDDLPLVVLVHGYPEYWWAWRNQLEPIAAAGHEVAAIDQRGIGGSDKTPEGADDLTLSHDIGAIARSLGASRMVVVGHGVAARSRGHPPLSTRISSKASSPSPHPTPARCSASAPI